MPTLVRAMAGIYGCRNHPWVSPIAYQQHHPDRPNHSPQRHQRPEARMLGLMSEEHHAEPAAHSPAQARHPQQRPLWNATVPLALRLRLVDVVKDET